MFVKSMMITGDECERSNGLKGRMIHTWDAFSYDLANGSFAAMTSR
jgi:hypothetical protein